jgi:hypothetical protein
MKSLSTYWLLIFVLLATNRIASCGPIEIVLNPSPQQFENACQSYSMALAVSLISGSSLQANSVFAGPKPYLVTWVKKKRGCSDPKFWVSLALECNHIAL